jgi:hypothetical protein
MPWSYVISTDLGGIMIAEDTVQATADAQYQLTNTIGQTTPTPVP